MRVLKTDSPPATVFAAPDETAIAPRLDHGRLADVAKVLSGPPDRETLANAAEVDPRPVQMERWRSPMVDQRGASASVRLLPFATGIGKPASGSSAPSVMALNVRL